MGKHCQGQTEIKLDSIGPTIRSEHHGNIEFRRLSVEHGGVYLNELKEGKNERRLTIRECARIQTFPDSYDFVFRNSITNIKVIYSTKNQKSRQSVKNIYNILFITFPSITIPAKHLAVISRSLSALTPRLNVIRFHLRNLKMLPALRTNPILLLIRFTLHIISKRPYVLVGALYG